jgi:hypothetical protein
VPSGRLARTPKASTPSSFSHPCTPVACEAQIPGLKGSPAVGDESVLSGSLVRTQSLPPLPPPSFISHPFLQPRRP